ncbi:hypothetical protein AVEN_178255-1 [Araneus ventricosus]|uniref:Uncharacterized protein n=1 Tax=Araneus ventricosus TaxID=182803 RepID=A0A4Y2LA51_ARAVE|nr:hypothetical protein AVEN_178255-1 [Araneus ventricosus]
MITKELPLSCSSFRGNLNDVATIAIGNREWSPKSLHRPRAQNLSFLMTERNSIPHHHYTLYIDVRTLAYLALFIYVLVVPPVGQHGGHNTEPS